MTLPDAAAFKRAAYADLGAESVTPDVGQAFPALVKMPDAMAFEVAQVADITIRHLAADAVFEQGDALALRGVRYQAAGRSMRIGDGYECVTPLTRAD